MCQGPVLSHKVLVSFSGPSTIEHVAFVFICKIVPGSSSTSVGKSCPYPQWRK